MTVRPASGLHFCNLREECKFAIARSAPPEHRPKYGTPAIAALQNERQAGLDLGDKEFSKFCDTFKLSPVELNNIFKSTSLLNLTRLSVRLALQVLGRVMLDNCCHSRITLL